MANENTEALLRFIEQSPSPFHVCENIADSLRRDGFTELSEGDEWDLDAGEGYFVRRNGSSVIAFRMPKKEAAAFLIVASHADSPTYKIKDTPELSGNGYLRLNTEPYGGMLAGTWLDRPLSVAGRLMLRDGNRIRTQLVYIDRDLLLIPNIAPHMTRIHDLNPAVDLIPLFGQEKPDEKNTFLSLIADAAGAEVSDIVGHDLYLVNRMKGTVWGANGEFIAAPRLDDLQCAFSSVEAFRAAKPQEDALTVCAVFDNEEVGSQTKQGAASTFLSDVFARIREETRMRTNDYLRAVANSFMVSADNAHAVHPNHPEFADGNHKPQMNGGVVIKHNAAQHYTTDAISAALFETVCKNAGVPVQHFHNRSDIGGGGTLGNIANTQLSLNTVDIGMPQLAMHSAYETAGAKDTDYLITALTAFYQSAIRMTADGAYTL